jgi:hypothetical protein
MTADLNQFEGAGFFMHNLWLITIEKVSSMIERDNIHSRIAEEYITHYFQASIQLLDPLRQVR